MQSLGYVLHHKDTTLKIKDRKRYDEWRIDDVEMMLISEHISLHHKGVPMSEEAKHKSSLSHKGKLKSDETRAKLSAAHKGKPRSDETRTKISLAQKGRKRGPLSEETKIKLKAFLWWTNGTDVVRSKECPGTGWKRGRIGEK